MINTQVFFSIPAGSLGKSLVADTMRYVLGKEGIKKADINCVFLSDSEIQRINKKYLKHNYPTDVISFAIETEPHLEAELYIGLDVARRQAKEYRVLIREEVIRLVVHGILHLCGYDDKEESAKTAMKSAEDRYLMLLRKHGILNP
jgi:probable rRNA maturation factor